MASLIGIGSDGWEVDRVIKQRLLEENTKLKIDYEKLDELHKELVKEIMGLETENRKVWERYREFYNQICKAIQYIKDNEYLFIDKHGKVQDTLEFMKILKGEE